MTISWRKNSNLRWRATECVRTREKGGGREKEGEGRARGTKSPTGDKFGNIAELHSKM